MYKQDGKERDTHTRFQSYALRVLQEKSEVRFVLIDARDGKRVCFGNGQQLITFLAQKMAAIDS